MILIGATMVIIFSIVYLLQFCRHIAVHAMKRLLFWSDVGSHQAIIRARVDGNERMELAYKLEGVTTLALDQQSDMIYYAHGKRIDAMDINGKNV